jgi:EAL domain-containing protein (putative c-di-GMP-specific phosphodiesterase class I)
MTLNRALTIERSRVGINGFLRSTVEVELRRREQAEHEASEQWRRYMVMVLDVAIGQCERRNLTAPTNVAASDVQPPHLVAALIEQLLVTHNLKVRPPRSNQHALDMLFALQYFYLPDADVDDAAKEALA